MSPDNPRHRLGLLAVTALSLFGALFARLWFLQIVEGSTLEEQVTSNATREVIVPAPRGRILDANNIVLVDNRVSVVVAIDWQQYRDLEKVDQDRLLERLAATLSRGRPAEERVTIKFLTRRLNDDRFNHFRPIPVAEDIPVETEIYFKEQAALFPTVAVERQTVRSYPYGSLAAHVLGYVGPLSEGQWKSFEKDNDPKKPYERTDEIGKVGVEASYEKYLRGTPGRQVFEVDRANRVVRELAAQRVEPLPGNDVHLSIDARIQYKAEEALQARIVAAGLKTQSGAAVVVNPKNGQIWAMASYPTYNPAELVGGISQELWDKLTDKDTKALSNRAVQEAYPAASTFKLASSYSGLKLGIITPNGPVADTGSVQLCSPPRQDSGCVKRNSGGGAAMGNISLSTALTRSSDVYFYKLGLEAWRAHQRDQIPEDALQREIKELGYGAQTGIDLTGETPGRVPTPESNRQLADSIWEKSHANYDNDEAQWQDARKWKGGYNADVSIGQFDTLVSPLQTAMAYASLANGEGRLYRPSILQYVAKPNSKNSVFPFRAEITRTIDWGAWRPALIEGFTGAVQTPGGTAYNTFTTFPLTSWSVAGKTGTAEVGTKKGEKRDNSLFVAFGPTADPEFVASVMIEGGGFGAQAAAPAVRMIFEPIANGEIQVPGAPPLAEGRQAFVLPRDGRIDAERAAAASAAIGEGGSD
ncbi:MAG: penicillin-binding protein 2 [Aquihabitans sp.]